MRAHRPANVLAWVLASAAPALAQHAPKPTPTPPPRFAPLLPNEGLLHGRTWLGIAERLLTRAVDFLPSLIAAALVLALFLLASRLVNRFLRRMLRGPHVDPALADVVVPLVRYTVLALGFIMALSQAGFEVSSLVAGVGVAGLALGLAAQDTLGNLVAGFGILWDRPFRIGDRVTIADTYGEVVRIGLRSTRLRTNDQLDVILPNREVVNKVIVNHTLTPNLRVSVPFSIPYAESVGRVRQALLAAVKDHVRLRPDPPPQVVVKRLGESAVDLELRVWLADPHTERPTRWALLELTKETLDAAGVQSAYPRQILTVDRGSSPLPVVVAAGPSPADGAEARGPESEG